VAEVVTMAKRELAAGETLDGIGGYTCYGAIETRAEASGLLPITLARGAVLRTSVQRDAPITLEAVDIDESSELMELRRRQELLIEDAHRSPRAGHPPQ
jgi:predicted homoserine dehydrogenase-like protein